MKRIYILLLFCVLLIKVGYVIIHPTDVTLTSKAAVIFRKTT